MHSGNGASATGTMVVDDTFIPNPGRYFGTLAGFGIQSLTLNVIDPDFGNGTYTAADFLDVRWDTNEATLDLSPSPRISTRIGYSTTFGIE